MGFTAAEAALDANASGVGGCNWSSLGYAFAFWVHAKRALGGGRWVVGFGVGQGGFDRDMEAWGTVGGMGYGWGARGMGCQGHLGGFEPEPEVDVARELSGLRVLVRLEQDVAVTLVERSVLVLIIK